MSDTASPAPAPAEVTATASAPSPAPASAPNNSPSVASALDGFKDIGLSPTAGLDSGAKPKAEPAKPAAAPAQESEARPVGRPSGRDTKLSLITDPRKRELLSKMANDSFDEFHDLALKLQNGEFVPKSELDAAIRAKESELKSARYFDHEKGYTLTPEYQALHKDVERAGAERDFWQDQLAAAQAGQPVRWLNPPDKDGNVTIGTEQYDPKANPSLAGQIMANIVRAETKFGRANESIAKLPGTHKVEYEKFNGSLTSLNKEMFGAVTNPAFKARADGHLNKFPAALRARPEMGLLANALAAGEMFFAQLQAAQAQLAKLQNSAAASASGAPAPIDTGAAPGDGTDMKAAVSTLHKLAAGGR